MNRWKDCLTLTMLGMVVLNLPVLAQHAAPLNMDAEHRMVFDHLRLGQGIWENTITAIVQDARGFLWFGTRQGVFRYDGYRLSNFRHDPRNPSSLSHDTVQAMYVDPVGRLWVGTLSGLNLFDRDTEQWIRYTHEPGNPHSLSSDNISAIHEDRAGVLWIGTNGGGLNRLVLNDGEGVDPGTLQFARYQHDERHPESLSSDFIRAIYEDHTGTLWIGTLAEGLNRFERDTGRFIRYRHDPQNPASLSHNAVHILYEDRAGTLWVGTRGGGLNRLNRDTGAFSTDRHEPNDPHSISRDTILSIAEDRSGVLWVGTEGGGLNRFDRESGQFSVYQANRNDTQGLTNNIVTALYADRSGVLWIGTEGDGVDRLVRQSKPFLHCLEHTLVFALAEDQAHNLWIGTYSKGLLHLDCANQRLTTCTACSEDSRSLSSQTILALHADSDGMLWIGTQDDGLKRLDPTTQHVAHYRHDPDSDRSLSHNSVRVIYEDRAGWLWVGTEGGGLNRLNRKTGEFVRYQHAPHNPRSLSDDHVWSLTEDRQGTLWVGTDRGLNRFDAANDQFFQDAPGPDDRRIPGRWQIRSIHADRAGNLWFGTRGAGLAKFDRVRNTVIWYTQEDGLPGNVIYGILEDEQGYLWLSTARNGIARFDPTTGTCLHFDVTHGLQTQTFNPGAAYHNDEGDMFFGGINGFNRFHPQKITGNPHVPPIVITDFQLFNNPVPIGADSPLQQAISETQQIRLSYRENVLSFEFAALDYIAPEQNQYAYMMEGINAGWVEAGHRRFVTYTHLEPGTYVFRVKGSNNDGVWNEGGTALSIVIIPPFWFTWWFKASAAGLLAGIILAVFLLRIRTIQHQKRLLEEQVRKRTVELAHAKQIAEAAQRAAEAAQKASETARRSAEAANQAKSAFLANMSHELRTPLNVILGFAQILERKPHSPDEQENLTIIQRSGEHLLTLINQVLDLSKIEAGQMIVNAKPVDLYGLLDDLEDMFSLRARNKGLYLSVERSDDMPRYVRTDEVKLRQVLINLLNNAVKFTQEGGVTMGVRSERFNVPKRAEALTANLQFSISDTGPGIAPDETDHLFEAFAQTETGRQAQEGTGLGLPISRKFVQLLGGDMRVKSTLGQGTTFIFDIQAEGVDEQALPQMPKVRHTIGLEPGQPCYRLLIVDDNPDNRRLLVKLLQPFAASRNSGSGFECREAENGQEAIELWQSWKPDLIWMDLRMPVLDGYKAIQHIKASPQGKQSIIIIMSASVLDEGRLAEIAAGYDGLLRKPFQAHEVFDLLHEHLGVRFVYAEEQERGLKRERRQGNEGLTPEALAALPEELANELGLAVEAIDIAATHRCIEQIRHHSEPLAELLAELVKNYRFDRLLQWCEHKPS